MVFDDDPIFKHIINVLQTNNELVMKQYAEALKQKNVWVAQIITIASAILGGFILSRQIDNLSINIGLTLLFIIISMGLMLIYRSNKKLMDGLLEGHGKTIDYYMRVSRYIDLSKKQELTKDEAKEKKDMEQYIGETLKDIGVLKEDWTLGSVYEKFSSDKGIDWANYLLIFGFLLAGFLLIFPERFEKLLVILAEFL